MTRTPKCFALSFYSGPRFVRTIHHHGWPYTAWLILSWNEIRLWFTWSICSVYCDYDFYSFSPLVGKDMKLMESSWWERLCGKLDLVLVDGVTLPKSWIKFSVDRWGCAPSLLLALSQTMVGVMKVMGTSFKMNSVCIVLFRAPVYCLLSIHASTGDTGHS